MFHHRFDDEAIDKTVMFQWFLLSFNGGCINAGGFMAAGRFVSHVTGFATLFGVRLTDEGVGTAFGILSVPLFFLAGAFVAGLLIERPIHLGRKPRFDWVMTLSSACLLAASAHVFRFASFGAESSLRETYVLMALLCLASGLQNAASSAVSTVRTTHMTGMTTDLGLGLARAFTFGLDPRKARKERRASALRVGGIVSFILGSAAGAGLFMKFGYHGFYLPAAIAAYAAWHGRNKEAAARPVMNA
jgi:uncharacterized membrane protein YoaK (UPF0700 family)